MRGSCLPVGDCSSIYGYEEAKRDALILTLGPPMCVIVMAIQAYSIWLYVDLDHSSVIVIMNIFVQYACNCAKKCSNGQVGLSYPHFTSCTINTEKYTVQIEPQRQKAYLRTCAPCKISDQPVYSLSPIRIFTERILGS